MAWMVARGLPDESGGRARFCQAPKDAIAQSRGLPPIVLSGCYKFFSVEPGFRTLRETRKTQGKTYRATSPFSAR